MLERVVSVELRPDRGRPWSMASLPGRTVGRVRWDCTVVEVVGKRPGQTG